MGYFFKKTSAACPEQYDVYELGTNVVCDKPCAYIRLRSGRLSVQTYTYDDRSGKQSLGDVIYIHMFNDDMMGNFTASALRADWLGQIVVALDQHLYGSVVDPGASTRRR